MTTKPYIAVCTFTTIDGKITTRVRQIYKTTPTESKESSVLHPYWPHRTFYDVVMKEFDAVMVGGNALRIDNSYLLPRTSEFVGKVPIRIAITGDLSTLSSDNRIFFGRTLVDGQLLTSDTYIYTSAHALPDDIARIEKLGAKVIVAGQQRFVDLQIVAQSLYDLGIYRVMQQGGGTLNWNLLVSRLVDEVRLYTMPYIAGGEVNPTAFSGLGAQHSSEVVQLELVSQQLHLANEDENNNCGFVENRYLVRR